jgi:hypothetical protein
VKIFSGDFQRCLPVYCGACTERKAYYSGRFVTFSVGEPQ